MQTYIEEGLTKWAKLVAKTSSPRDLKKAQAWWFGMPVKLSKGSPASKKGESFEVWGRDAAVAHGKALKSVVLE